MSQASRYLPRRLQTASPFANAAESPAKCAVDVQPQCRLRNRTRLLTSDGFLLRQSSGAKQTCFISGERRSHSRHSRARIASRITAGYDWLDAEHAILRSFGGNIADPLPHRSTLHRAGEQPAPRRAGRRWSWARRAQPAVAADPARLPMRHRRADCQRLAVEAVVAGVRTRTARGSPAGRRPGRGTAPPHAASRAADITSDHRQRDRTRGWHRLAQCRRGLARCETSRHKFERCADRLRSCARSFDRSCGQWRVSERGTSAWTDKSLIVGVSPLSGLSGSQA